VRVCAHFNKWSFCTTPDLYLAASERGERIMRSTEPESRAELEGGFSDPLNVDILGADLPFEPSHDVFG